MASGKLQFRVGDTVMHKKLGRGDILDVYPLGEDVCAVISFEKWGQKKIILKFANLEIVSRAKTEAESREDKKDRKDKHPVEDVDDGGEADVGVGEDIEADDDEVAEEDEEEHKGDES